MINWPSCLMPRASHVQESLTAIVLILCSPTLKFCTAYNYSLMSLQMLNLPLLCPQATKPIPNSGITFWRECSGRWWCSFRIQTGMAEASAKVSYCCLWRCSFCVAWPPSNYHRQTWSTKSISKRTSCCLRRKCRDISYRVKNVFQRDYTYAPRE